MDNSIAKEILTKNVMFTGGGSGGHIAAGMAIVQGFKEKYSNAYEQIIYIGGKLPMEGEKDNDSFDKKVLEKTDIPFRLIRAGKFQRYFSLKTLQLLFGVIGGMIDAFKEVSSFKPDLIISTGGYVTVPICFAGWTKGIPIYIHEQTAAVGLTNKIAGKFAKRVYLSFEQSREYFKPAKALLVGNAVRPAIFEKEGYGDSAEAIKPMLEHRVKYPIVLVVGGGQGCHLLNQTLRQMIRYLVEDYQLIIQTGDNSLNNDYEKLSKERLKLPKTCQPRVHITKYINSTEVGVVYNNSDLFIGRSGANLVYEMAVLRKPSIFVPIPWVTHNEQFKNAQTLEEVGLAKILPEGEVTGDRLNSEIKKIFKKIESGEIKINEDLLKKKFPLDAVQRILSDLPL